MSVECVYTGTLFSTRDTFLGNDPGEGMMASTDANTNLPLCQQPRLFLLRNFPPPPLLCFSFCSLSLVKFYYALHKWPKTSKPEVHTDI